MEQDATEMAQPDPSNEISVTFFSLSKISFGHLTFALTLASACATDAPAINAIKFQMQSLQESSQCCTIKGKPLFERTG